jgi:hypothetical protein
VLRSIVDTATGWKGIWQLHFTDVYLWFAGDIRPTGDNAVEFEQALRVGLHCAAELVPVADVVIFGLWSGGWPRNAHWQRSWEVMGCLFIV